MCLSHPILPLKVPADNPFFNYGTPIPKLSNITSNGSSRGWSLSILTDVLMINRTVTIASIPAPTDMVDYLVKLHAALLHDSA